VGAICVSRCRMCGFWPFSAPRKGFRAEIRVLHTMNAAVPGEVACPQAACGRRAPHGAGRHPVQARTSIEHRVPGALFMRLSAVTRIASSSSDTSGQGYEVTLPQARSGAPLRRGRGAPAPPAGRVG
jgi:hypothetical protein